MDRTMTASDRRWLSAIYVLGALSALIFALLKSSAFMATLRDDAHVFGDLYDFARIEQFRAPLPAWVPPVAELRAADVASADLIAVGDSFLRTAHGAEAIVDQIARELACRVYSVPLSGDPARVLRGSAAPERRRVLLLESAEHRAVRCEEWERQPRAASNSSWLAVGHDLRRRWFIAASAIASISCGTGAHLNDHTPGPSFVSRGCVKSRIIIGVLRRTGAERLMKRNCTVQRAGDLVSSTAN